jgi:HAD superfamily hydrolase (TIGR01459 family)
MSSTASVFSSHFSAVAPSYDVLLCDVWGVVHNGVAATKDACDALKQFRVQGGTVVLITNAPRPGAFVQKFMDNLKVPHASYDAIVSSGDVTHALILARAGQPVAHIGPSRDEPIFDGIDAPVVSIEDADYVVCSGLYDDTTEGPDDYEEIIATMLARDLTMICANPDVVVERGDHLVYCAGAIADRYVARGGKVIYAGKPYRPIYDQAVAAARKLRGKDIAHERILAIGDSVRTDLKGAAAFGIDSLFVTAGIHAEELGGRHTPDPAALSAMFENAQVSPKLVMQQLAW